MKKSNSFHLLHAILVIGLLAGGFGCESQSGGEGTAPGQSGNTSQSEPGATASEQAGTTADFLRFSPDAVAGANVYVPVYSHIYQHSQQKTFNLTTTLSIRNTDLGNPITVNKVYYYDSEGELVHRYLEESRTLAPLSSMAFVVEEEDLRGGVGANFLVLWEAAAQVNQPVIEAVMISTSQQQGISFVSTGRVIYRLSDQQ